MKSRYWKSTAPADWAPDRSNAKVPTVSDVAEDPISALQGFRLAAAPEIVLAFLRGELDSERFGADVRQAVTEAGGLHLVHNPDLGSVEENEAREHALSVARGWRTDAGLFKGFPETVDWYHGPLQPEQLSRVRFINYSYWVELSGGSRRPGDVLATLRAGRLPTWLTELGTRWCFELATRLAAAEVVDDLIVVATPDLSELVVLEGHARLTAIFVGGLQRRLTVRAYLGLSAAIERWELF
jgi:hypothetical protein